MRDKDWHELWFWERHADLAYHGNRLPLYLAAWGILPGESLGDVLEIGTGPLSGFLPLVTARRKVGIDPLYTAYRQSEANIWREAPGCEYVEGYFDEWETADTFDTILCADALDHGEMGFATLAKICRMLRPGGRFCLHVHLRPDDYLNCLHDHQLTVEQLDEILPQTDLIEMKREYYENDIDGKFCRALVGVWRRPA